MLFSVCMKGLSYFCFKPTEQPLSKKALPYELKEKAYFQSLLCQF